jgi:hypothetical protein
MNIFILDENIEKNCEYHCDKHVVKMIVEYAQLGCSAHHIHGEVEPPYKKTHVNHPCSVWARESMGNYEYLVKLGKQLCKEYTTRYSKKHKTEAVFEWLESNKPNLSPQGMTKFALAMPEQYRQADAVQSYREYYINEKSDIAKWKFAEAPPYWFVAK